MGLGLEFGQTRISQNLRFFKNTNHFVNFVFSHSLCVRNEILSESHHTSRYFVNFDVKNDIEILFYSLRWRNNKKYMKNLAKL